MSIFRMTVALALACSAAAQTTPTHSREDGPSEVSSSLVALFDNYDLIALGQWHNSLQDSKVRMGVIRHPAFAKKVRNVVIECGNSLYQDTLDRFVNGNEVSRDEIQKVWRDTTQSPLMDARSLGPCEAFIQEIRTYNRSLPASIKIRVLAGDSPIDWSKVNTTEHFMNFLQTRDESAVHVIEREILRKRQRGLIIYGAGQIWRNNLLNPRPNVATLLDKGYPGKLFTVVRLSGPYPDTAKLESLIPSSDRPVFIQTKAGPVADLNANQFIGRDMPVKLFPESLGIGKVADACVYTGKNPDTPITLAENQEQDPAWNAEIERRRALMPHPRR